MKNGVLHNLSLVSIVLSPDDNPYLVFESLNAKGQPLTEADLIRNYLFMRIETSEQEEMYKGYWLPMQINLGDSLTEFIRHFLMGVNLNVKKKDLKNRIKLSRRRGKHVIIITTATSENMYKDDLFSICKSCGLNLYISVVVVVLPSLPAPVKQLLSMR